MIEISIIFIILLIYGYFWKKYRLFEADTDANTDTQKKRPILADSDTSAHQ